MASKAILSNTGMFGYLQSRKFYIRWGYLPLEISKAPRGNRVLYKHYWAARPPATSRIDQATVQRSAWVPCSSCSRWWARRWRNEGFPRVWQSQHYSAEAYIFLRLRSWEGLSYLHAWWAWYRWSTKGLVLNCQILAELPIPGWLKMRWSSWKS